MVLRLTFEDLTEQRHAAQKGHLVVNIRYSIVDEARDSEALAIPKFHFGVYSTSGDCRNKKAGDRDGVGVVKRAHFRPHFQVNRSIRVEVRCEFEADAKLFELDRHRRRRASGSALYYREGKLATREKICFFAGLGKKVGLS